MITFRLLVPAVDAIRPSTPLDVRDVPAVIVPPAGEDESADFAAWLDALAAETGASNRDAHMAAADASTRDDGELYHGRLPSEDVEPFSPYVIARAEVYPGPIDAIEGAQMPAQSWMGMRGGAA